MSDRNADSGTGGQHNFRYEPGGPPPPAFGTAEHLAKVDALNRDAEAIAGLRIRERLGYAADQAWLIERGLACDAKRPEPEKKREPVVQGVPTAAYLRAEREKREQEKAPSELVLGSMDHVAEEEFEWLWPGRFALGAVGMIMGRMGNGKSTLRDWIAATVSGGHPWPDCPDPNEPGTVLILQAEESKSKVVKHRMNAFGYGRGKVFTIDGVKQGDGHKAKFSLGHDVDALARACDRLGDVRLVIVDPIASYLRGVKGNSAEEVRECLDPVKEFAEDFDVSVILIAHPNKNAEGDILDRVSGSGAFAQVVRSIWYLSEDPNDKSRKLFTYLKDNIPGTTKTGLAVHYDDRKKRITWFSDPVKMSGREVDYALQRQAREAKLTGPRAGRPAKESKSAEEFLAKLGAAGPFSLAVAREKAMLVGISASTLRRAVNELVERKALERYEVEANGETRLWFRALETAAPPAEPGTESGPESAPETGP